MMISEHELEQIVRAKTAAFSWDEWQGLQSKSTQPVYDYRLDHIRHVVALCKYLTRDLDVDRNVLILAAWLHDIAKPGMGETKNHGEKSAKLATSIMQEHGVDKQTSARVANVIRSHVGLTLSAPLDQIEAQILWEADKLDKIGIVGFVHYIVNGIRIKPGMLIDDMAESVRGYLPLAEKIAASMHTEPGKKIAEQRLQHLREISEKLDSELSMLAEERDVP